MQLHAWSTRITDGGGRKEKLELLYFRSECMKSFVSSFRGSRPPTHGLSGWVEAFPALFLLRAFGLCQPLSWMQLHAWSTRITDGGGRKEKLELLLSFAASPGACAIQRSVCRDFDPSRDQPARGPLECFTQPRLDLAVRRHGLLSCHPCRVV